MSRYNFLVHRGKLTEREIAIRERAAGDCGRDGVTFVYCNLPGDGWMSWFEGPNMGAPFDDRMAAGVRAMISVLENQDQEVGDGIP